MIVLLGSVEMLLWYFEWLHTVGLSRHPTNVHQASHGAAVDL